MQQIEPLEARDSETQTHVAPRRSVLALPASDGTRIAVDGKVVASLLPLTGDAAVRDRGKGRVPFLQGWRCGVQGESCQWRAGALGHPQGRRADVQDLEDAGSGSGA
eukprot:1030016-Lingulodinium_polyedra.AAC.1